MSVPRVITESENGTMVAYRETTDERAARKRAEAVEADQVSISRSQSRRLRR